MEFVSIIVYILIGISAFVLFFTSPILSILIISIALIIYLILKVNKKTNIKRIQKMNNEELLYIIEEVLNQPTISITPWVSQKWFPLSKEDKLNWIIKNEEEVRYCIPRMNTDANTLMCLQKIDHGEMVTPDGTKHYKPSHTFIIVLGTIATIVIGSILLLAVIPK